MAPSPSEPVVPQVPHCDVTRTDDGLYRITHKRTGDSLTADTEERVTIAGVILRLTATWHSTPKDVRFTTGYLP